MTYSAAADAVASCGSIGGAEIARPDTRLNRYKELNVRRTKKKSNMLTDKRIKFCLSRFHSGAYSHLQFLRTVNHSVAAHTESLQPRADNESEDEDDYRQLRQAPVSVATTSVSGVGIGNGSRGNNLGRLLRSVHCGATCWLRTGAVRTYRTRRQYMYTRRRNDDKENF